MKTSFSPTAMQLEQLAQTAPQLRGLLQRARHFQSLEAAVKRLLPPNIAAHLRVACISEGSLIVQVSGNTAAARIKMLLPALLPKIQALDPQIVRVQTKVLPPAPAVPRDKPFRIAGDVLPAFEQTAEQVAHHPALATALRRLAERQRRQNAATAHHNSP